MKSVILAAVSLLLFPGVPLLLFWSGPVPHYPVDWLVYFLLSFVGALGLSVIGIFVGRKEENDLGRGLNFTIIILLMMLVVFLFS